MLETLWMMDWLAWLQQYGAVIIFVCVVIALVTELVEHALSASVGALLMLMLGYVSAGQAVEAIAFPTLLLIMSMMILVGILQQAGLFNMLSLKIANWTTGSPLLIFVFFAVATVVFSSILGGVATILIVLPIVISLLKQMNISPLPYVIAIIMCTNIGASTTVIGDATNSLIAGETGFSFNSFLVSMTPPAMIVFALSMSSIAFVFWQVLKPINYSFLKLTMAHLTIKKINRELSSIKIHKSFFIGSTVLLLATILAFLTSDWTGRAPSMIACVSALIGLLAFSKYLNFHHHVAEVDWPTLMFFTGLFIMVAGVENSHIFDAIPQILMGYSDQFFVVLMFIVWSIALISMFFDNIPFILIMIPIVASLEAKMKSSGLDADTSLLWRAISIGGIYGGNGTIIAGVQNIVGISLAAQYGYKITFMRYFKYGFPITILSLIGVSVYLYFITL